MHVVVGNQDTDIPVFQVPDDVLDVFNGNRVNASERFVEHDKLRIDSQAAGNLCTTALTTRQLVTIVLAHLVQTELCQQFLQLVLALFLVQFLAHLQYRHDIVFDTHLAEDGCLLRQVADAGTSTLIYWIGGNLLIVQIDVSAVRHHQTGRHIERGGLAGSIGSQQTYNLALLDVEAHAIDHRTLTIAFDQSVCAQLHLLGRFNRHSLLFRRVICIHRLDNRLCQLLFHNDILVRIHFHLFKTLQRYKKKLGK